jgi:hypothetical protein
MEPVDSLLCSQQPADPYTQPDESSQHPPILFPKDPF